MTLTGPVTASVSRATDAPLGRPTAWAQRGLGIALLIAIVALDQAAKAWAWRQAPAAVMNPGSTGGMGGPVNAWFTGRATGALLDVVSLGVLCGGAFLLGRISRPPALFVSAAVMLAGWASNLLDRLGLHSVTAPGSIRGVVDFIPFGRYYVNVADVFIVGATIMLLVLVARGQQVWSSRRAGGIPLSRCRTGRPYGRGVSARRSRSMRRRPSRRGVRPSRARA